MQSGQAQWPYRMQLAPSTAATAIDMMGMGQTPIRRCRSGSRQAVARLFGVSSCKCGCRAKLDGTPTPATSLDGCFRSDKQNWEHVIFREGARALPSCMPSRCRSIYAISSRNTSLRGRHRRDIFNFKLRPTAQLY